MSLFLFRKFYAQKSGGLLSPYSWQEVEKSKEKNWILRKKKIENGSNHRSKLRNTTFKQADDLLVSFWCAFRIFSFCLFDRSYQMLKEKATFFHTLSICWLKVITLILITATGLWQSQQTESVLWRMAMFCLSLMYKRKAKHCKTLPCVKDLTQFADFATSQ